MGKFRRGAFLGFTAGYWFGSKAGRERHEQLKRLLGFVQSSPAYQRAAGKAKAAVGLSFERGKLVVMEGLKKEGAKRADGTIGGDGQQV